MKRIVIESPLAGDTVNNFRYLLWCCRAALLVDGVYAIASHLICPWYMDDSVPAEREAGIANPWCWQPGIEHWFFLDLGLSGGMEKARVRLERLQASVSVNLAWSRTLSLAEYHPGAWAAFQRGEWPPHTAGFEIASQRG